LTARVRRKELSDPQALGTALRMQLADILHGIDAPAAEPTGGRPLVILMVGVNGAGKTTTIGKLARRIQDAGQTVMLAAGDTFRAAAVEQLQTWGERNDIPVISQANGADAASVIYDALEAATARKIDVLIADTAGRLHTKSNLMDELGKISRVLKKIDPEAPHEVMLVVDAGTGQNALNQAVQFHETVGLTGITLTKLDGTAKGGIVFAIADRLGVPIRFIGVGESIEDLRPFDADEFVKALFE
ncbi:MAG: signal recognition particle-docking protein FtsY, partial [Gammaproteobacteria bacterium]|nr:signal recognition particle-docking protein FtsY [Gammaproteobacteria bacterium]